MIPYEKKEHYTIDDLAEIVTLLRSKDGCPWDKVQTHESIRPDLIEETYEVIEAIDQNDPEMLREELGDVLLQVVFHSRIETEQGHFTLDDVCTDICNKLIIRHPHVFSTVQADTTEEVLKNWDTIKEETKHQTTRTQTLEAVAKTLPALMRAQKVCKRALKGNNRFLCNESVLASVTECKHTLEEAMHMEDAEQWANCCSAVPAWLRHWGFRRNRYSPTPPTSSLTVSVPWRKPAPRKSGKWKPSPTASGMPSGRKPNKI